ncbi:MAG: aminoglycoside phosphotransferase family protein [Rhodothermaceae bacterium]|nr:aminoglycoside phosphotransferase family protein [Rhodothermaceae bacterium]
MTRDEFVAHIADDSDRIAQDALVSGFLKDRQVDFTVRLVCDVVDALSQNLSLSRRIQAHRLEKLLLRIPSRQDRYFLSLAQSARGFPAHFRVTVANVIPDSIRSEVYRSGNIALASVRETTRVTPSSVMKRDPGASGKTEADIILLFSHPDHQVSNRKLLTDAELYPIVVDTFDKLKKELATNIGVCGCVIDQSVLVLLDPAAQNNLFKVLAKYSSFIVIRVHDVPELLVSPDEVRKIIKKERQLGIPVPNEAIWFQPDRRIRETELSFFKNAAELLHAYDSTSFVLGDLNLIEARLLVAAARARTRAERPDSEMGSEPITIRFLHGGLSGARLVTVNCGVIQTLVAKVTCKDHAFGEMQRFQSLIKNWDRGLSPECHFHGNAAVIFFNLVRADSGSETPAEPLEKRLSDLWNDQWLQSPSTGMLEERIFLEKALTRVARTLAELNKLEPPQDGDLNTYVNPPATHLNVLDQRGFIWGLNDCAKQALEIATGRFRRMERSAIVHGDIHLRNILIRGESEVHLIDFAESGPGHPAVDLVRFELALYLGPVRQFEADKTGVAFQRALSIEHATLDHLKERFPTFFQVHVNTACAVGMTAARDFVIEVLGEHGGDIHDYLAVKFLVAWQHLGIIGSQTGHARAVILATADEIAGWRSG